MTTLTTPAASSTETVASTQPPTVHYHTVRIGDVDVFYREAGAKNRSRFTAVATGSPPRRTCFAT